MLATICLGSLAIPFVNGAVMRPLAGTGRPVVLAFNGRSGVGNQSYDGLLSSIQAAAASMENAQSLWIVTGSNFGSTARELDGLRKELVNPPVFYACHGMLGGSCAEAQMTALQDPDAVGVVLLAGFLERARRPSTAACAAKWAAQPTRKCPKGIGLPLCLGGYLSDGAHSCSHEPPSPDYALPTLTVGGGQDGIVRVSRLAEAWYTQQSTPSHKVALVEGMSHVDLLTGDVLDPSLAQDLPSEIGAEQAQTQVAELVAAFVKAPDTWSPASPDEFFQPFVEMFVEQEGSWWWTGSSDEAGSSNWGAEAQRLMAEPVPAGFENWAPTNQFRLLSDEDAIPPYYRNKHRAEVFVQDGVVHSSTITQLRYTELSVGQVSIGLNGYEIIKEETSALLNNLPDDGDGFTSAIEIATKLASRQLVYNRTGVDSPASLDDGDRCKAINQAAYDLALRSASKTARARFEAIGRPLLMVADVQPFPPAGPWWIWNYLQFNDHGASGVEVASYFAFYGLDGLKYGAGNHYCKLLSPARALEWIYTDGLRTSPSAHVFV